jgi:hypothetical protein
MRKLTNTLSPSPKGFQSPKFSDSDFREGRGLGLGLGRPKSSGTNILISIHICINVQKMWIIHIASQIDDIAGYVIIIIMMGECNVKVSKLCGNFF